MENLPFISMIFMIFPIKNHLYTISQLAIVDAAPGNPSIPSTADALLMEAHHAVLIHFFFHCLNRRHGVSTWAFSIYKKEMRCKWTPHLEYQIMPNHIQLAESIILGHSNDVNIKYLCQSFTANKAQRYIAESRKECELLRK